MKRVKDYALGLICALLCGSLLATCLPDMSGVSAAPAMKNLTLKQAQALAIYNSSRLDSLDTKLNTKRAALKSAIKSIKVKKKSMSTIRWSPLLKFKWPQNPKLSEAYEFQFKPISIQYEIDTIQHSMVDQELEERATVSNLFVEIVVLQRQIAFNDKRRQVLEESIAKTAPRVLAQDASQTDLDNMQKALDKVNQDLINEERSLLRNKKKLSNKIKVDVTANYTFEDPLVESELSMDIKDDLIQYTKDRDQVYYEACVDETEAKMSAETNYGLLKNFYNSKYIRMISPYINAALRGEDFSTKAFSKMYDLFVERVNEKWKGKKKILFFKFPKIRQQGEIDGERYIQDNPMVMLEDTLAYKEARLAREDAEAELVERVEEALSQYIDVRNSYNNVLRDVAKAETDLEKASIANKSGVLLYSEYQAVSDNFEDLQATLLDTAKLYSKTLYSLDRTTCGGVSAYLGDLNIDLTEAPGGYSYVVPEIETGAHYYIRPIIQETQFQLGVTIPEDFGIALTSYEVYVNNELIGERKDIDKTVRHLAFNLDAVDDAFIRFYNGNQFVDDVKIDPQEYSGPLDIVKSYNVVNTGELLGRYELTENDVTGNYSLSMEMMAPENITFFRLKDASGRYLIDDKLRKVSEPFIYIPAIVDSMDEITFEFFDESEASLYTAHADVENRHIVKDKTVEEGH